MQVDASQAALFALFAVPICIYTFFVDLKHKRITNPTVWALFAVFMVIGLLTLPFIDFLWRFAGYAIFFAYGFVLWMVRQMGAGDVKFGAVAALFIHPGDAMLVLIILAAALLGSSFAVLIVYWTPLKRMAPDWASWAEVDPTQTDKVGKGRKFTVPMGTGLGLTLATYLIMGSFWGQ